MKAHVYAVITNEGWSARMSIGPGMDLAYWLDHRFRATLAAAGYMPAGQAAQRLLLCSDALPLGVACRSVELWEAKKADPASSEEARLRLAACVEAAGLESEAASGYSIRRQAVRLEWYVARGEKGGRGALPTGRAQRQAAATGESGQAGGRALAEAARLAGAALHGRALLRGEAQALLAVAGAEAGAAEAALWAKGGEAAGGAAEGALRAAGEAVAGDALRAQLQLAALLGMLQLRSAVAAAGGRCRCLRCGSGERQMRRSPCASCGRMCAYCEACLTMGRSRECELLVLGVRQSPLTGAEAARQHAEPSLPPAAERLLRWRLSPAQSEAAARALHFLEHEAPARLSGAAVRKQRGAHAAARSNTAPAWKKRRVHAADRSLPAAAAGTIVRGPRRQLLARAASCTWRALKSWLPPKSDCSWSRLTTRTPLWAQTAFRRWKPLQAPFWPGSAMVGQPPVSPEFLLWAVTGAGKTEMVFPLIESVLLRGGKALLATPRKDVVLELDPRIRKAFPHEKVVTLYGGSEQRWESGSITLATTHQLFRFYQGFELVIIDELDAFPFHGDAQLHYAAAKSCSPSGATVLLSATPPAGLQRAARRGRLPYARVPVRYHRHPLPVPKRMRIPSVKDIVRGARLPKPFASALARSLQRKAQLFVFVQQIRHVEPLVKLLREAFAHVTVEGTYSSDPLRLEKVRRFRSKEIRMLVTTTILERGVTIPRSDIFILDADGRLFDEASLVQMAGRAGRSADDPFGGVYFCSPFHNRSQLAAIRQIRTMNRIARRKGYLLPQRSR